MRSIFATASFFILVTAVAGCGFRELPRLHSQTTESMTQMLLQYRLRADLVPHFMKLIESKPQYKGLYDGMKRSYESAIGMDMPVVQFDGKQMNRLQSFQFALSAEMTRFFQRAGEDKVLSATEEFKSLKEQWDRAEARIASARQQFMADAPQFNHRLGEFPERFANRWIYKLKPFPELQNSASQ